MSPTTCDCLPGGTQCHSTRAAHPGELAHLVTGLQDGGRPSSRAAIDLEGEMRRLFCTSHGIRLAHHMRLGAGAAD